MSPCITPQAFASEQSVGVAYINDLLVQCMEHQNVLIDSLNTHIVDSAAKKSATAAIASAAEFGSAKLMELVSSDLLNS